MVEIMECVDRDGVINVREEKGESGGWMSEGREEKWAEE